MRRRSVQGVRPNAAALTYMSDDLRGVEELKVSSAHWARFAHA